MTEVKSGSRHVTYDQVKAMLDFMGQNRPFAMGILRSLEARQTSKKLWSELTQILNDYSSGTKKTPDGWSKYWSDFKNKLKNKAQLLKNQKNSIGLDKSVNPLTKLERRALMILEPQFKKKHLSNKMYGDRHFDELKEVKCEPCQENNMYFKIQDSDDKQSGDNKESDETDHSSNEEYEEIADLNSNKPLAHNLYPKWLIEVEKKRADAELLRATAEEKRASSSVQSAEAAMMQAGALKKLAEAASAQANAIARIATALENRGRTNDILSVSSSASLPGHSIWSLYK